MELTIIQKRLVNAYAILVMAGRRKIEEVPTKLQGEVNIRVAEIEIEKLS